jgi:signal transduction histidine kinase
MVVRFCYGCAVYSFSFQPDWHFNHYYRRATTSISFLKSRDYHWLLPAIGALISCIATRVPYFFENILLLSLLNTFAVMSSHRFMKEQADKLTSQQLVRERKATQLLLSNTSKRDERLCVARDLHDSLGHNLTALSLQLEVAIHQKTD